MLRWLRFLGLGFVFLFAASSLQAEVPNILLAEVYRGQVDISKYLVSEKLDGVRAIWDGQTLRFRSGKQIHAPNWFIADLPKQSLDGELWIGRGQFDRLSGIVRQEVPNDAAWKEVHYMIFELPNAVGSFSERAESIRRLVRQAKVPWLREIEQFLVVDRSTLDSKLKAIVRAGGEGLMLHLSDAPYQTGRSEVLLKVKLWQDAEATVIGYRPGKGKHHGVMGALHLQTPEGRQFYLGTGFSDQLRKTPPIIGSQVTYRYRDLTKNGVPRFASFLRVREE